MLWGDDDADAGPYEGRLMTLVGVIAVVAAGDVLLDLEGGGDLAHVLSEAIILALSVAALVTLLRRVRARFRALSQRIAQSEEELRRWRVDAEDALRGLGACIDRQFERWQLTAAERETALLLLKGLSHREIAAARAVSEATARQQAGVVYRKAGVSGRSGLAAFFLEDLALPADPPPPPPTPR